MLVNNAGTTFVCCSHNTRAKPLRQARRFGSVVPPPASKMQGPEFNPQYQNNNKNCSTRWEAVKGDIHRMCTSAMPGCDFLSPTPFQMPVYERPMWPTCYQHPYFPYFVFSLLWGGGVLFLSLYSLNVLFPILTS